MAKVRQSSIARKLTLANVLVSALALAMAFIGFLSYDMVTFRSTLVDELNAQAHIVGDNSVSALLFDDPKSASETLAALKETRDVEVAAIYAPDGSLFATYQANPREVPPPSAPADQGPPDSHIDHASRRDSRVIILHPIIFQNKFVGTVYIRAQIRGVEQRALQYLKISALVLGISLLIAWLISTLTSRALARPLAHLADVASLISRNRDYSVRAAERPEQDEIGVLVRAFNEMLTRIQEQAVALGAERALLEDRVAERTAQLTAANKEMQAFSYSVAHDLRGPLEVINGFAFILETSSADKLDVTARECLDQLRNSVSHMSHIIDDLLNLSRVARTELQTQSLDLSEMARNISAELARMDPARNVEFIIPGGLTTLGDPGLIRLLLDNLLRNAWKYTSKREHARIEFGQRTEGNEQVFFLRDNGAGFNQSFANKLFQPFQRLHSSSDFPGTGIGLATVLRIVHRHNGRIWAEGLEDRGATFYFTLNLESAPPASTPQ
jgi:signal transduction histidine kinase